MQTIGDAHVLQVAKPGVEADENLIRILADDASVLHKAGFGRARDDGFGNARGARGIERLGAGVFIEQSFDFNRRAMGTSRGQRRRQMADADGGKTAFGLRGLAGIVDDEGIDQRHGAQQNLGRASFT